MSYAWLSSSQDPSRHEGGPSALRFYPVHDKMHNALKHFVIYSCPLNKVLESASFKNNVSHCASSKGIMTRLRSWATFSMARNKRSLFAWDFNKYAVSSSSVCAASHTLISISLS